MDMSFTAEELAFRDEVRAWIKANLPAELKQKLIDGVVPNKEDIVGWHRKLNAKGWAVPHWPVEWGGQDWTATKRFILREELETAPAPLPNGMNVGLCGPVVAHFGTTEQKKRFLPRMANCDDWWCQGFSEPGSGSDLASLQDQRAPRRRPLHRQRLEDVDHQRAVCRLDFLPRPHRSEGEEAGRHLVPAVRHEEPRRQRAPGVHHGRRRRGQPVLLRGREGAGRSIDRRREQGLGLREIPARQRAHGRRPRRRHARADAAPAQAGDGRDQERQADHRGPVVPQPPVVARGRGQGA